MTEGHSPCTAPACPTCERWRAYGLLAQVVQAFHRESMMGSREWGFEDEEIERYQQVASETYWQNLDAVALLAIEHARLEKALVDAIDEAEDRMLVARGIRPYDA